MKKIIKTSGIIILSIIVVIIIAMIYISVTGIPKYDTVYFEYKVDSTPELIERGKKLSLMLCAGCHKNPETGKLTGKHMLDVPPEFGKIYSQNITQDKQYGIGNWTDAELVYLLRTGIKKDGHYSPPYMVKLPHLSNEDMNAIIAFLRSDDELVKADPTPDNPCEPSLLTKILTRIVFKPFPMPTNSIENPDTSNMVELGRYLSSNLDCFSCHSSDFKTNNYMVPELSKGYFGGGNKPLNNNGQIVLTSNLTPDPETGIGNWTEEQFVKAVKYNVLDNEPALQYPMSPYVYLTDHEAASIYQYLKTIPPIKNKVNRIIY